MKLQRLILIVVVLCASCARKGTAALPKKETNPVSSGAFTGLVSISILEGEPTAQGVRAEVDTFNLSSGEVHKSFEKPQPEKPFGSHIRDCRRSPPIESPDGKSVAQCSLEYISIQTLRITDRSGRIILTMALPRKDEQVIGLSWAPDSHAIAILTRRRRIGWTPGDLVMDFAGHPVPYVSLRFYCYSLSGNRLESREFFNNVLWGQASISWLSGGASS